MSLDTLFTSWNHLPAGSMPGWEFIPLRVGNEVAAVAALLGPEIHFAIDPTWRRALITRRRCREFLTPLLARYGYLCTRSVNQACAFVERLGFVPTEREERVTHYMLTKIPFSKEN